MAAASLGRDIAHAVRQAANRPGFSAVVALTLALGIGVNTAVFSIVNSVLLRPLPYRDSDRLYTLFESDSSRSSRRVASYPTFLDWHEQVKAFDGLAFVRGTGLSYDAEGRAGLLLAAFVSEEFFPTLGVDGVIGRTVTSGDYHASDNNVAVLSHRTWISSFGGDSGVVGRTIRLANRPVTVVGVMPNTFAYPNWGRADTDVWLPMSALSPLDMADLGQRGLHADSRVVARLAPGVSLAEAQLEMDATARRLAEAYPDLGAEWTRVSVESLREFTVGEVRSRLLLLSGAVAVVLLICCVNLAGLYLVHGVARRQEFAIRSALGAGRSRVMRQLLTESLVVATPGGALGTAFAIWAVEVARVRMAARFPRAIEIAVDLRVLVFAASLTVLAAFIFGAVAGRPAASPRLADWLRERGSPTRSGARLSASLLAAQVALTFVLLAGASLLLKTFVRLSEVHPGFDASRLVLVVVRPPSPAYDEAEAASLLYARLAESVRATPGVERVALVNHAPIGGGGLPSRAAIGEVPAGSPDAFPVLFEVVSAGYFATMGIPMTAGREFTDQDLRGPPGPVIVNATLAQRWGDRSAVGDRLGVLKAARTRGDFGEPLLGTVVGVAGDVKHFGLDAQSLPTVYVPYSHNVWPLMTLVARTAVDPALLIGPIEAAIRMVDPAIPLDGPGLGAGTMAQRVVQSYAAERLNAGLVSTFALAALLLATIGIYGVTSYAVTRQTRDIGIRIALGAPSLAVQSVVVRGAALATIAGIAAGVVAALVLTRFIQSLLFAVQPTDPATFVVVTLVLLAVATIAAYVPARRAARVDPTVALRTE